MWHAKICHICLRSNFKMLIKGDDIKSVYSQITGFDLKNNNGLQFCINCVHYMRSFHIFKQKCLLAADVINKGVKRQKTKLSQTINKYQLDFIDVDKHKVYSLYGNECIQNVYTYTKSIPVINLDVYDRDDCLSVCDDGDNRVFSDAEMEDRVVNTLIKTEEEQNPIEVNMKMKKSMNTREDIELKRQSDKRYKSPSDLQREFKIEFFLTEEEQREEFQKRSLDKYYLESKFKCEKCLKGFREQKLLDLHLVKHQENSGLYLCNICQIRLPTSKSFRTHRDSNHTCKFSCLKCDFVTFSKAQARNHVLWHQGIEHSCPHCPMTFRKYTTLMGHLRIIHPSSHICGCCANSFVSAHGLNHHIKLMHKDVTIDNESGDSKECKECNVTFVNHKVYIKHILISRKHQDIAANIIGCRECGEEFPTKELLSKHNHSKVKDVKRKDMRSYECTQCTQQYTHPTGLYQHFVRSHPNVPYRIGRDRRHHLCEWCGKTFMCQSRLLSHKRLHTGEKPFSCKECPKSFRTQPSLTKHTNTHNGIKLYNCAVCLKKFTNSGNLFKHMRIHAGVKPFKCDICSKSFVDSSNLRQHVNGVHYNVRRVRQR